MDPEMNDTRSLLGQAGAGKRAALEELFTRHRPRLLRMAEFRLDPRLRGRIDPGDVVQETYLEAFGRFFALETLLQSLHTGETHNWRLVYDAWRRRFVPMAWDLNPWAAFARPLERRDPQAPTAGLTASLDPQPSRLHVRLLNHPRVAAARAAALHQFFGSGKDALFLDERVRALEQMLAAIFRRHPSARRTHDATGAERLLVERGWANSFRGLLLGWFRPPPP